MDNLNNSNLENDCDNSNNSFTHQTNSNVQSQKLQEQSSKNVDSIKKCKFCPTVFKSPGEYLNHIETTHQGNSGNNFMCSDCGKQYKTKSELTHHIKSKCGTLKQFKCEICKQELMSSGSLYNHMLRHKGERSFMCRFCAKLFFTAGQLKVHERIHTQDKAYVCEICNKGFCHRQSLITHSTIHTGIKPFQCENCGNSFSCVGNLLKHRKTHSDTCGQIPLTTHRVKNPNTKIKVRINTPANSKLKTLEKNKELKQELELLKNEVDGQQEHFSDNDNQKSLNKLTDTEEIKIDSLNVSDSINHNDESKEFDISALKLEKSDENGTKTNEKNPNNIKKNAKNRRKTINLSSKKKLNSDIEFQQFVKEWQLEGEKQCRCKFCNKIYVNPKWLFKHIQEHGISTTLSEEKQDIHRYKCSCCKQVFSSKEEVFEHQQKNHTDVLTCQDCDKIFANRDSLQSHIKIFHKGIMRKTYIYICKKCGKQFKSKSFLIFHESKNCDEGPFYECDICKKQFSNKQTRNNHMRIHDPEKKLFCKFCAKSFRWKGQLKIHERSHTGEKPFTCLYCPKAFAYRESLITHSTIHTGIKPHFCEGCGSRFSCIGNLIKHRSSHAVECGAWTYKSQKYASNNQASTEKV